MVEHLPGMTLFFYTHTQNPPNQQNPIGGKKELRTSVYLGTLFHSINNLSKYYFIKIQCIGAKEADTENKA
jgi:hypothetical protein